MLTIKGKCHGIKRKYVNLVASTAVHHWPVLPSLKVEGLGLG